MLLAHFTALEEWTVPVIHVGINDLVGKMNVSLGTLAQPLRLAKCGGTVSPPIDVTLAILGQHEALLRLAHALETWAFATGNHD